LVVQIKYYWSMKDWMDNGAHCSINLGY
jgi:hypothetical protein